MKGFILAFIGSYCPAMLFNIERKNLIRAGLCGSAGWLVYSFCIEAGSSLTFSAFAGSMALSIMSELMARLSKTPATVFLIPAIFPLVPGISAYYTVLHIVQNSPNEALIQAIETGAVAGAIAFGIMVASNLIKLAMLTLKRYKSGNNKSIGF